MKISVIVPVYNCEAYLPACLDSILNQSHSDLQIILVEDGSPDCSGRICNQYAEKDSRIFVIHQENQGVSAARNAGLACASGEAVTFVDSDDTIDVDMYETLSSLLVEHHADVAVCGYKKIYFDGSNKEILGSGAKHEMDGQEACRCVLTGRLFTGSPCTKLYRRELFDNLRFDTALKINEDILMNIQAFQECGKVVFWDVCKYNYFEREQSATRVTNAVRIKEDCVTAAEKMLHMLKKTPLKEVCLRRLRYALLDLYRAGLFCSPASTRQERRLIHNRYRDVSKQTAFHLRTSAHYSVMRYLPWMYVKAYRLYQKLHKQDNDI